jgi:hypothetical protein
VGFLRLGDANRNTGYISTVSDVGICFLPSSFAFGLSLLFLTLIYIFFGVFLPLHYQPRACHKPSCHNINAPSNGLLHRFWFYFKRNFKALFFTVFRVSYVSFFVVLPFNSVVLYYIFDAQLFLLPQHVRTSQKIQQNFSHISGVCL